MVKEVNVPAVFTTETFESRDWVTFRLLQTQVPRRLATLMPQAAVWATHAHSVAGDRLAVAVGPLGYLAGELLGELPRVLVEVGA